MAIIVCDTRKSGPTFASYNIYGTNTIDKERICKKCLVKVVYFTGATQGLCCPSWTPKRVCLFGVQLYMKQVGYAIMPGIVCHNCVLMCFDIFL